MNILFEEFPDSVCVNGENYQIETDFREWIRFIQLVEDDEVDVYKRQGQTFYLVRSSIEV